MINRAQPTEGEPVRMIVVMAESESRARQGLQRYLGAGEPVAAGRRAGADDETDDAGAVVIERALPPGLVRPPRDGGEGVRACPDRFAVKVGAEYVFVKTGEIDWIEADDNYVVLHVGGRSYLVRETMNRMEERLDPRRFLRIRRSAIVNLDRVQSLRQWSAREYQLVLHDGTELLTSRRYRDRLRAYLL